MIFTDFDCTIECESKSDVLRRWTEEFIDAMHTHLLIKADNGLVIFPEKPMEAGDLKLVEKALNTYEKEQSSGCENGCCSIF